MANFPVSSSFSTSYGSSGMYGSRIPSSLNIYRRMEPPLSQMRTEAECIMRDKLVK